MAYDKDGDGSLNDGSGRRTPKREGRRYGDSDIRLERSGMASRAVKWCVVRGEFALGEGCSLKHTEGNNLAYFSRHKGGGLVGLFPPIAWERKSFQ